MTQRGTSPTTAPAWQEVQTLADANGTTTLRDLFAADPARGTSLVAEGSGLYLDYSKQRVDAATLDALCDLADQRGFGSTSRRCSAENASMSPRTAQYCMLRCGCPGAVR